MRLLLFDDIIFYGHRYTFSYFMTNRLSLSLNHITNIHSIFKQPANGIIREAAENVRLIYQLFLDGMSIYNIALKLKELGILNPTEFQQPSHIWAVKICASIAIICINIKNVDVLIVLFQSMIILIVIKIRSQ